MPPSEDLHLIMLLTFLLLNKQDLLLFIMNTEGGSKIKL